MSPSCGYRPALVASTLIAALSSIGCGDTCHDGSGEVVSYAEGQTNAEGTYYQSGPLQGPYLHFPSGRIFELEHALVAPPNDVRSWLSFDASALLDRASNVAESAGNQVVIECADEQIIRVRNDTCADFYLRVSAEVHGEGLASPMTRRCRE